MFGLGKKKEDTRILNPQLGLGAKVILGISVLILVAGLQGGIIGGALGGGLAYGFYTIAIGRLAKYKKIPLMVEKPPLTKEELEKKEKSHKFSVKFWIIFLSICGIILVLAFLLA
ncbi:MAG: hypothetical protein Q7S31_00420 [bacterium]|nr:hypothetical protein [bacterium]